MTRAKGYNILRFLRSESRLEISLLSIAPRRGATIRYEDRKTKVVRIKLKKG